MNIFITFVTFSSDVAVETEIKTSAELLRPPRISVFSQSDTATPLWPREEFREWEHLSPI